MMSCAPIKVSKERLVSDPNFPSNRTVYKGAIDKVVWIKAGNSVGSGFFIRPHFLVTNKHVVEGHDRVDVYFPVHSRKLGDYVRNRNFYRKHKDVLNELGFHDEGRVVVTHEELDLALIQIDLGLYDTAVKVGTCNAGQDVHILGNPSAYVQNHRDDYEPLGLWHWEGGKIASCKKDEFVIEATVFKGNSGGPVLDDEGRVIGVITSSDFRMTASAIPVARANSMFADLLLRTEQGQQIIEVVSIENRTNLRIPYKFSCGDKYTERLMDLGIDKTAVHFCWKEIISGLGIEISPSVSFDYTLDDDKAVIDKKRLDSNWQFAISESFESDIDYRNDSRKYYFDYDANDPNKLNISRNPE